MPLPFHSSCHQSLSAPCHMFCQGVGCLIGGLQAHNKTDCPSQTGASPLPGQLISLSRFYIINSMWERSKRNLLVHRGIFSITTRAVSSFCNTWLAEAGHGYSGQTTLLLWSYPSQSQPRTGHHNLGQSVAPVEAVGNSWYSVKKKTAHSVSSSVIFLYYYDLNTCFKAPIGLNQPAKIKSRILKGRKAWELWHIPAYRGPHKNGIWGADRKAQNGDRLGTVAFRHIFKIL